MDAVHAAVGGTDHNGRVRRGKPVRTAAVGRDGTRTGLLFNCNFIASAPNAVWVTEFT